MSVVAAAPQPIEDAVEQTLGALLRDRDVSEIDTLEGGLLQVLRRGRRERLDAILEGPLFGLLRDVIPAGPAGSGEVLRFRLRGGHALSCGLLVDGRLALRIGKAPALDASLDGLVEEGLLPPGIHHELLATVLEGAGLLVLGPSRAGRQRVVVAVMRAVQAKMAFFGLSDALAALVPVPSSPGDAPGGDVIARARDAVALGADGLCALELTGHELAALVRASPGLPLVASVAAPHVDALVAALDGVPQSAAAGQTAIVGFGPDGQPRLIELHGPPRESAAGPTHDGGGEFTEEPTDAALLIPREVSGMRERPRAAATVVVEPADTALPQLAELPAGWASDAPDDDPGWELAGIPGGSPDGPPSPGSFDAALAAQKQRPSFAPRAPRPHPQAQTLQSRGLGGDPFGGLTFEPPPGGPGEQGADQGPNVDDDSTKAKG